MLPALYAAHCSGFIFAPLGASNVLSPVLVNGTATGPFAPAAPVWMCAAVAVMPLAVTFAPTVQSSCTVTFAEPVAELVFGGTSLLPESVKVSPRIIFGSAPPIMLCIVWHPARRPKAPATARARTTV